MKSQIQGGRYHVKFSVLIVKREREPLNWWFFDLRGGGYLEQSFYKADNFLLRILPRRQRHQRCRSVGDHLAPPWTSTSSSPPTPTSTSSSTSSSRTPSSPSTPTLRWPSRPPHQTISSIPKCEERIQVKKCKNKTFAQCIFPLQIGQHWDRFHIN